MINKIIIGILAFLLIISGGSGYYSYTLSQKIDYLGKQLADFKQEQTIRINTVSNEMAAFQLETVKETNELGSKIDQTTLDIDNLESDIKQELGSTRVSLDTLEFELNRTTSRIGTLESEMPDIAEISQSVINANQVYTKVNQATVRISNGESYVGSGFILDNDAHVLTAHHVIEDISEIYVTLSDGRIIMANIAGSCPISDVAVLKLHKNPAIAPPSLADSAQIRVGEPVAVIGNPFNLTETLTAGIVSQTERFVEIEGDSGSRWVANLIQFDAAANFGNSGGPLANSRGEIIGVVVARIDPDEGDGIYYAVSANKIKKVAAGLIAQGSYDYPRLGISVTNLTPQIAKDKFLETINGAWVQEILADTPAVEAGIQTDDIIVGMDGVAIKDIADLISYLGENKSPGDETTITLIRGATQLDISLTVGSQPQ